ncbi:hypothetical protein [Oceanicaulis sp.]|uniref:DUF7768 domain-containing protein n=1 Tax=Oceanicaulis sp. TaxID=1924941 RepID=UPI003D285E21
MKRVIIESPYAGDVDASVAYARACLKGSLKRGEAPIASHLLYTQPGILDDDKADERALGIDAGHAWIACADLVVVYHDLGVSEGMQEGIRRAFDAGKPVEFRKLPPRCPLLGIPYSDVSRLLNGWVDAATALEADQHG